MEGFWEFHINNRKGGFLIGFIDLGELIDRLHVWTSCMSSAIIYLPLSIFMKAITEYPSSHLNYLVTNDVMN